MAKIVVSKSVGKSMTDSQGGSIGRGAPRSDDDVVDVWDRPSAPPSVAAAVTAPLDERGVDEE